MKIEMTAEDREWMLERAVDAFLYGSPGRPTEVDEDGDPTGGMAADIKRRINERLDGLATKAFEEAVTAEVGVRVQAILDAGWPVTSLWGEHTGKRVTIRELILEKLQTKVVDSYRGTRKTLVEHLVGQAVEGALGKELQAELARAQAELRAAVDGAVTERLSETLRTALGLR